MLRSRPVLILIPALIALGCQKRNFHQQSATSTSGGGLLESDPFLEAFKANPKEAMNRMPTKLDENWRPVSSSAFSKKDIADRAFIAKRDAVRANFCRIKDGTQVCLKDEDGRAIIAAQNDRPEDFVDNPGTMIRKLDEMEAKTLTNGTINGSAWSDDYWGIYKGILGARYADDAFTDSVMHDPDGPGGEEPQPRGKYFTEFKEYVTKNSPTSIVTSGNAEAIAKLSPSEKYDLIIGDASGKLTASMWRQGQGYWDSNPDKPPEEKVETWMGICHGWAPAAFMVKRPALMVSVPTPSGLSVPFYPSDLKGLASYLWSSTNVPTRFIGGRCNTKDPQADENGRVLDRRCFDTNPGTWHMAIVNQIGVSKRSFVMDATFDYQVWNQPVSGYSYRYFNPITRQRVATLAEATVDRAAYTDDKFARYRSPQAKKMVGVIMDVQYVVETYPTHNSFDRPDRDALHTVTYRYDLELNEAGEIIGGEWYSNKHPDFLWVPEPNAVPKTPFDRFATSQWDGKTALPADIRTAATRASESGLVLPKIVYGLVEAASMPQAPAPTPNPEPNPNPVATPAPVDPNGCVPAPLEKLARIGAMWTLTHGSSERSFTANVQTIAGSPQVRDDLTHKFFVKHSETDQSNMAFKLVNADGSLLEGIRYNITWDRRKVIAFNAEWICNRYEGKFTTTEGIVEKLTLRPQ